MKQYTAEELQAKIHSGILSDENNEGILNRPGEYLLQSIIAHLGAAFGMQGVKIGLAMNKKKKAK